MPDNIERFSLNKNGCFIKAAVLKVFLKITIELLYKYH